MSFISQPPEFIQAKLSQYPTADVVDVPREAHTFRRSQILEAIGGSVGGCISKVSQNVKTTKTYQVDTYVNLDSRLNPYLPYKPGEHGAFVSMEEWILEGAVPLFCKRSSSRWEYCGHYKFQNGGKVTQLHREDLSVMDTLGDWGSQIYRDLHNKSLANRSGWVHEALHKAGWSDDSINQLGEADIKDLILEGDLLDLYWVYARFVSYDKALLKILEGNQSVALEEKSEMSCEDQTELRFLQDRNKSAAMGTSPHSSSFSNKTSWHFPREALVGDYTEKLEESLKQSSLANIPEQHNLPHSTFNDRLSNAKTSYKRKSDDEMAHYLISQRSPKRKFMTAVPINYEVGNEAQAQAHQPYHHQNKLPSTLDVKKAETGSLASSTSDFQSPYIPKASSPKERICRYPLRDLYKNAKQSNQLLLGILNTQEKQLNQQKAFGSILKEILDELKNTRVSIRSNATQTTQIVTPANTNTPLAEPSLLQPAKRRRAAAKRRTPECTPKAGGNLAFATPIAEMSNDRISPDITVGRGLRRSERNGDHVVRYGVDRAYIEMFKRGG